MPSAATGTHATGSCSNRERCAGAPWGGWLTTTISEIAIAIAIAIATSASAITPLEIQRNTGSKGCASGSEDVEVVVRMASHRIYPAPTVNL